MKKKKKKRVGTNLHEDFANNDIVCVLENGAEYHCYSVFKGLHIPNRERKSDR